MNDQGLINDIIKAMLVVLVGTNGLTFSLMYILRMRADTQKIKAESDAKTKVTKAESDKDARIKQLEIQLERTKGSREKSRSDENQTGELIVSQRQLLVMLGKEIDQRAKSEKASENNYQALKGLIDRGSKEMQGMVEGLVTKSLNTFKFELQEATASGIAQIAARNVLSDFTKGIKYPISDDCRWHICMVKLEGKRDVNVWNYPLNMGKVIWKISDTERAYIIAEQYSLIPGWAAVRPVDAPEVEGWVDMHHVTITDCDPIKNAAQ